MGPGLALGFHLEEIDLDQRGLGGAGVSNNHLATRESDNHNVGREKVEEGFLEDS